MVIKKKVNIPLNIIEVERGENIRLNVLVYGRTGVGKTRLVGSAQYSEYTSPMLFLDFDGGTISISNNKAKVIRPQSFAEVQEIYEYLWFENRHFRSVGIDSLTELQRKLSMGEIRNSTNNGSGVLDLTTYTPPDRYDWLQSGEQMRKFIRAFKELAYHPEENKRIHVFMTAWEKVDDKMDVICPSLPGVLGLEVGGFVDVLARMSIQPISAESEKRSRQLSIAEKTELGEEIKHLGKARTPEGISFPTVIWKPTINKLLQGWMDIDRKEGETE